MNSEPENRLPFTRLLSVTAPLTLVLICVGFLWELCAARLADVTLSTQVLTTFFEAVCFVAWIVGIATVSWLAIVSLVRSRTSHSGRSWAPLILFCAPVCGIAINWVRKLFEASRFAGQPQAIVAELGIDIAIVIAAVILGRWLLASVCEKRTSIGITCVLLVGTAVFAGADQALFVRHYPPFHHLMVFGATGLAVIAFLPFAMAIKATRSSVRVLQFAIVVVSMVSAARHVAHQEVPAEILGWADRSPIWGRAQVVSVGERSEMPPPRLKGSVLYSSGRVPDATLDELLPQRQFFNVLWITIDALRADHVSSLGYHRPTTPHLDALARESIMFRRAVSQSPSSPLSFASMFSGKYPRGLRPTWSALGQLSLAPTKRFAESMVEAGVATMGILALEPSMKSRIFPDLERGFEKFIVAPVGQTLSSGEVVDAASALLKENNSKRWMMWAHFFDPHMPYRPNPKVSFGAKSVDLYDGEIAAADASLGRLLDGLRQRPDWDRTVVVVQSDHGEEFGDHGGAFHGSTLHQEQVWVPLVIRVPGLAPRQVDHRVQLVDIVPTLHRILGLAAPVNLHGRSLMRHVIPTVGVSPIPNVAVAQLDRGGEAGFDHAVWIDNYKMIHDARLKLSQWFDLDADPKEQTPIKQVPALTEQMAYSAIAEVESLCSGSHGAQDDEQSPQRPSGQHDEAGIDAALQKLELNGDRAGVRKFVRGVLATGPPTRIKQSCLFRSFVAGGLIDDDQIRELLRDTAADVRASAGIDVLGRVHPISSGLTDLMIQDSDARVRALGWTVLVTGSDQQRARAELTRIVATTDTLEARLIAAAGLVAANEEPWVGLVAPVTTRDDIPIGASIALMLSVAKLKDLWFTIECADDLHARNGGYVRSQLASRAVFPMAHRVGVGSLRRFVMNGDLIIRSSGERVLADLGRTSSRDGIRATQDAMTAAVGIAERSSAAGVKALEAAFQQSVAAQVADATPLIRGWRLLLQGREFDEARRLAKGGSQVTSLPVDLPPVFERLATVAQFAGMPIVVKKATVAGDTEVRSDGAWLGVLHLTLDERSGSLVGGRDIPAAAIGVSVRTMDGIGDERPILFPLPLRGVLPGETISLMLFHSSPFNAAPVTTLRVGLINPVTRQVLPQLAETRFSKAP